MEKRLARCAFRVALSGLLACVVSQASSEVPAGVGLVPNLVDNIDRPLRYHPDAADFVIVNGSESFNRSMYGAHSAFRVDGGDRPEFLLYLPGRGGNLRFGIARGTNASWLKDMAWVESRYRPGELLYQIKDPMLGQAGSVRISVLAHVRTQGILVKISASDIPSGLSVIWGFGGVNGQRGARDGDLGTEKVPISEYFQLRPEFCEGNEISLSAETFTLRSRAATLFGLLPQGSVSWLGDAKQWNDPELLLGSAGAPHPANPILMGRVAITASSSLLFSVQRVAAGAIVPEDLTLYREVTTPTGSGNQPRSGYVLSEPFTPLELPVLFAEAESHVEAIRSRVCVVTPDPYLNAAVGALNVAADAVWDDVQRDIMHGAIAWRTRLLGWRGPYLLDDLGWHDRAAEHFDSWAKQQNQDPVSLESIVPDEASNLARNERGLHSNGDISHSHYDMNLVYIDALFRHLLWTGDREAAKRLWPTIERHLAWERRLFRREFGEERLPLYEAYAAIWASDNLQYEGGGAAHASAYNAFHNHMAARIASLVGSDPTPYETEARLIEGAMRRLLWIPERGTFAEYKDLLGLQLVHPSAALWTFYHTVDSGIPSPDEGLSMARAVDRYIPHLPVRGPGVPAGLHVLATSDWMPYEWSLNNVVMAESVHAALAFWQVGRPEEAWNITKGSLLACMYMGASPGNVGSMSYLDVYRRESQRDFADGSGVLSRALVEGLFGVRPDTIAGVLVWMPGFPSAWNSASIKHPDFDASYTRRGLQESYTIDSRFARPLTLRLELRGIPSSLESVTVNGSPATPSPLSVLGCPQGVEIAVGPARHFEVRVTWKVHPTIEEGLPNDGAALVGSAETTSRVQVKGALDTIDMSQAFNDRVTRIFLNSYRSPRSPFVSLSLPKQGLGGWAGGVNDKASIDDAGLRSLARAGGGIVRLPGGVIFRTPSEQAANNVLFTSRWANYPISASVGLSGRGRRLFLLMAGSTNPMQSRLDNGEVVVGYTSGPASRLALRNPETWWPIERDYFVDDYQFRLVGPFPTRLDLATGRVREIDPASFKGKGSRVPGGSATVLTLDLDQNRMLRSLEVRALSNDVVVGLLAATIER